MSVDVYYNVFHDNTINGKQTIDASKVIKRVLVKGGSGVATKRLETPLGVVTAITDEEAELLRNDETFLTHQRNGYVIIRDDKVESEVAVADMESRDDSAPYTPEDGLAGDPNASGTKKDRTFKVKNNLS